MKQLTREEVVKALTEALEPLDYVLALWEGGAAGFGRADEWSDIDAQLIVEDDRIEDAFAEVERALEKISGVERKHRLPDPTWHGSPQCFYQLKNTSPFLMIDLCILKKSAENDMLLYETHGRPVVCFDKGGYLGESAYDPDKVAEAIENRLGILKNCFEIFSMMPLKETYRGNHVEAMYFYLGQTYRPLLEALRIKHCPQRWNYFSRYVYYDLPPDVVKRLEALMFFPPGEMEAKVAEVAEWFREISCSISMEEVRDRLKAAKQPRPER